MSTEDTADYILQLKHISKFYPGVTALNDVSLNIRRGEIHALIGENGAGKSTLIKTCSGAIAPSKGEIVVNNRAFSRMTPKTSEENGIGVIYQEFNLVGGLSVAENIFLGRAIRKGPVIDRKAMADASRRILDALHMDIDPNEMVKNLSVGYQQMVEISKAISQDAQILIMDEPSAPLTNVEVEHMFAIVRALKEKGVTIIYISHRLEEVLQLSDRITVLRDGQYVVTLNTAETSRDEMVRYMVGRQLSEIYPKRRADCIQPAVVFEARDVSGNGLSHMNVKIHEGEVLGLGGLVGAGRTEFAELIFGMRRKTSGQFFFKHQPIDPQSPRQAIDIGIGLVPEDRKAKGALLELSVQENINMPVYAKNAKTTVINKKLAKAIAERYTAELRIKTPGILQKVKNLSGGNQQKVILAKWLAAASELLIFDEPTRGIDVGAKREIYLLINRLVEAGKSVLMISSEMEELMGMSDRILVLADGRITGELKKDDFDPEKIMSFASEERQRDEHA